MDSLEDKVLGLLVRERKNAAQTLSDTHEILDLVRERCAQIAEAEPELPGPMPDENWVMSQKVRLEDHLRAVVRCTKKSIAERIRKSTFGELEL